MSHHSKGLALAVGGPSGGVLERQETEGPFPLSLDTIWINGVPHPLRTMQGLDCCFPRQSGGGSRWR